MAANSIRILGPVAVDFNLIFHNEFQKKKKKGQQEVFGGATAVLKKHLTYSTRKIIKQCQ
jgi:hypothetical protein